MNTAIRSNVRSIGTHPQVGWMGVLGGLGVFAWGGLLFGWFNGYLGSTSFRQGVQLVLGPTAIALLATFAGGFYSVVTTRVGRVILWVMSTVVLAMFAGVLLSLVNEIGTVVVIASYILLVASGTALGVQLLHSGGPRVAGWSLTISGPVFLLTDKLLWEPLNALLGVDITAALTTGPFAVGMMLLGRAIRNRSDPSGCG